MEKNISQSAQSANPSSRQKKAVAMGQSWFGSKGESSPCRSAWAFMGIQIAKRRMGSSCLASE
jgi:hypothetical protein